jgi:glycine/D-amino acid oxidase-like deaminating enzyme
VSQARADVVVVGGGLVGLSLAYELATIGVDVTVVDASLAGGATGAGAGILSPDTNGTEDDAWWEFGQRAGDHYPSLIERLRLDGADIEATGYGTCGLLSIGLRKHENTWFEPFAENVIRRTGGLVHEITIGEAISYFPPLGQVHRALYSPRSCRMDGRGMAAALRHGANAKGVHFVEGRVAGFVTEGVRIQGVRIEGQEDLHCDAVAIAGGAWSQGMGEWLDFPLPIEPTKGQIVHLDVEEDTSRWPIAQPLLTHYLVPWPGGRVACGGTFEVGAGFSSTATAAGIHELFRECLSVAPGLGGASYYETRVGLRPTSPDDRPIVGVLPDWTNAWVVTGHGANGLLQGPYSSLLLAEEMTDRPGREGIPDALAPSRFI